MFPQFSSQQHETPLGMDGMDVLFDIDIDPNKGATVTGTFYHPCGLPLLVLYGALSNSEDKALLEHYSPIMLAGLYSQLCVATGIEANDHVEEKFILVALNDPSVAIHACVSYDGMKWHIGAKTLQYLADLVENATNVSH